GSRLAPPRSSETAEASPQFTGQSLGHPEVVGRGDLEIVRRIRNQLHRKPCSLTYLGVISRGGDSPVCRLCRLGAQLTVGVTQHLPRKALRRLRAPDPFAVHGTRDARREAGCPLPNFLQRVRAWHTRHGV